MTRNHIRIRKKILRPLGIIGVIFILIFLSSPFIWIWMDFNLATKFGLTGIIGTLIIYFISKVIRRNIEEGVDDLIEKNKKDKPKGAFELKLEEIQKKREEAKSKNS